MQLRTLTLLFLSTGVVLSAPIPPMFGDDISAVGREVGGEASSSGVADSALSAPPAKEAFFDRVARVETTPHDQLIKEDSELKTKIESIKKGELSQEKHDNQQAAKVMRIQTARLATVWNNAQAYLRVGGNENTEKLLNLQMRWLKEDLGLEPGATAQAVQARFSAVPYHKLLDLVRTRVDPIEALLAKSG